MRKIPNRNNNRRRDFNRKNNNLQNNKPQLNDAIRYEKLIVIDDANEKVGVITKNEALRLAEEKDLDLLVVSEHGQYPIAKIINYEKYRYEQQKKEKSNRKKQTVIKVKKVTFRPSIGLHDLEIKAKKAKEWLLAGDSVRVIIRAPGRIMTRSEIINDVYEKFIKFIGVSLKIIKPLSRATPISLEALICEATDNK